MICFFIFAKDNMYTHSQMANLDRQSEDFRELAQGSKYMYIYIQLTSHEGETLGIFFLT